MEEELIKKKKKKKNREYGKEKDKKFFKRGFFVFYCLCFCFVLCLVLNFICNEFPLLFYTTILLLFFSGLSHIHLCHSSSILSCSILILFLFYGFSLFMSTSETKRPCQRALINDCLYNINIKKSLMPYTIIHYTLCTNNI